MTNEQKKAFEEKLNLEKRKLARASFEGDRDFKQIANNLANLCSEILLNVSEE